MSTRSVVYLNTSSWYSLQTRSFIKWQTFWSDPRKAINIEENPEWSIQFSTCGLTNLPACWNYVIRQDLWIFDLLSQIDVSQSNQKIIAQLYQPSFSGRFSSILNGHWSIILRRCESMEERSLNTTHCGGVTWRVSIEFIYWARVNDAQQYRSD